MPEHLCIRISANTHSFLHPWISCAFFIFSHLLHLFLQVCAHWPLLLLHPEGLIRFSGQLFRNHRFEMNGPFLQLSSQKWFFAQERAPFRVINPQCLVLSRAVSVLLSGAQAKSNVKHGVVYNVHAVHPHTLPQADSEPAAQHAAARNSGAFPGRNCHLIRCTFATIWHYEAIWDICCTFRARNYTFMSAYHVLKRR